MRKRKVCLAKLFVMRNPEFPDETIPSYSSDSKGTTLLLIREVKSNEELNNKIKEYSIIADRIKLYR